MAKIDDDEDDDDDDDDDWSLKFFRLKIEKQRNHWKRLFKARLHMLERYLQYRYFKYNLYELASSPSTLWTRLLPAVELVWLSGLGRF